MKRIDLNIQVEDLKFYQDTKLVIKSGKDVSKEYIELAFMMYQRQPDQRGAPTGLNINDQRKVYKILDLLDNMKEGIIDIEDDYYNFLKKIFNSVNWAGGTKIVVRIADRIDNAMDKDQINKKDVKE